MSRIGDYAFGRVTVDGREETRDVIVLPQRVVRDWWRRDGHSLVMADLEAVAGELPRHLVVGTGAHGRLEPDPGALAELEAGGIEVDVLPTPEAVARYAELPAACTAAALHLTC